MGDAQNMAQAAAVAGTGGKAIGSASVKYAVCGLIFAAVSSASVMMAVTMPKTRGDFFASIMSTVIASMCGGAYVSVKLGLVADLLAATTEQQAMFALAAIIGASFVCGLPAWAIVRGLFVWTEARKNHGLDIIIDDARKAWRR